MPRTKPGEVWLIDLGLAANVRPCLVLSDYPEDDELALLVIVPHTTAVRNNRWELNIPKTFLKPGVFHLQQLQTVPIARLEKRLGVLTEAEFGLVKATMTFPTKVEVAWASAHVSREITGSRGLKPTLRRLLSDTSTMVRLLKLNEGVVS